MIVVFLGWSTLVTLALVVVSGALAVNRRRWSTAAAVAVWVLASGAATSACVLLAGLVPVTIYAVYEIATLLPRSPGSWLGFEFHPGGGWAVATAALGGPWLAAVGIATVACGLRGSGRARRWLCATVLASPVVLVFPFGMCRSLDQTAWGLAVAATIGFCDLALVGLSALMISPGTGSATPSEERSSP